MKKSSNRRRRGYKGLCGVLHGNGIFQSFCRGFVWKQNNMEEKEKMGFQKNVEKRRVYCPVKNGYTWGLKVW